MGRGSLTQALCPSAGACWGPCVQCNLSKNPIRRVCVCACGLRSQFQTSYENAKPRITKTLLGRTTGRHMSSPHRSPATPGSPGEHDSGRWGGAAEPQGGQPFPQRGFHSPKMGDLYATYRLPCITPTEVRQTPQCERLDDSAITLLQNNMISKMRHKNLLP